MDLADAQVDIAVSLLRAGRLNDAAQACQAALRASPDHARAWAVLGEIFRQGGQPGDAVQAYRKAVALYPGQGETLNALGVVLTNLGRLDEAIESYRAAIAVRPNDAGAHNNLGVALLTLERLDEAEDAARRALALDARHLSAQNTLGNILLQRGQAGAAAEAYRAVLDIEPRYVQAHMNLGRALAELGCFEDARDSAERAVAVQPDLPEARFNLGIQQLRLGDFANGWANYAWRRRMAAHPLFDRSYDEPSWDGAELGGRTLFLYNEQGAGDAIQFVRFAALAARRGARVVLEAPKALHALFCGVEGVDALIAPGDAPPPFDVHAALLDLPMILGISPETFPPFEAYLHADPARVEAWAARIPDDGARRVGVVWAGNPDHRNDRNRSIAVERLLPLSKRDGVRLYSLQVGRDGEALEGMMDLAPLLTGYGETAAALMHLDLVITVDTSVAHLAGAMGRDAWTLIASPPDWRWMLGRDDTPWYPTMRLFRQTDPGGWDGVLARVADALTGWT
ncbi:MAG: tetratricopeptide repeat protein [Alphaproteobacteria bacterium]|nr:tetratricopeptide repeat protein [Alphaproteobacteria bacterium]